jgi:hypothetical protein
MEKRPLIGIIKHPFEITKTQLENADEFFRPILATPATGGPVTIVEITTDYVQGIELVATFSPAEFIANGVRRVAGQQTVDTNVMINFNKDLTLYWMASVFKNGDISPNQSYHPYSRDNDNFSLSLNKYMELQHDEQGWHIPEYDSEQYTVNVGFGMGVKWIAWGYSVLCSPQTTLSIKAGSYDLVRSNGQEEIGDPVVFDTGNWAMPMGYTYTLKFDSRGNGVLTRQ